MKTEAYAELERLCQQEEGLRPEFVVAFAADPATALHDEFTWDDAAAAHEHRLWQARTLIRAVVITAPDILVTRHAYVHVAQDGDRRYLKLEDVLRRPDLYDAALRELRQKVAGIERSISELTSAAREPAQRQAAQRVQRAAAQLAAALP